MTFMGMNHQGLTRKYSFYSNTIKVGIDYYIIHFTDDNEVKISIPDTNNKGSATDYENLLPVLVIHALEVLKNKKFLDNSTLIYSGNNILNYLIMLHIIGLFFKVDTKKFNAGGRSRLYDPWRSELQSILFKILNEKINHNIFNNQNYKKYFDIILPEFLKKNQKNIEDRVYQNNLKNDITYAMRQLVYDNARELNIHIRSDLIRTISEDTGLILPHSINIVDKNTFIYFGDVHIKKGVKKEKFQSKLIKDIETLGAVFPATYFIKELSIEGI
jgi:hypothetical protein